MAVDWGSIASEVSGALKSIGSTDAGFPVTLRRKTTTGGTPWDSSSSVTTFAYTTFAGFDKVEDVRDRSGTLIGQTRRTLMVDAVAGIVPSKDDEVAVGITAEQAEGDATLGTWLEIVDVKPLSPAGTPVMYAIDVSI